MLSALVLLRGKKKEVRKREKKERKKGRKKERKKQGRENSEERVKLTAPETADSISTT